MSNGIDDSTTLCVTPVFDKICASNQSKNDFISLLNTKFLRHIPCVEEAPWKKVFYGRNEKRFSPSKSRLRWLVTQLFNSKKLIVKEERNVREFTREKRNSLFQGDPETKIEAEDAIEHDRAQPWMIFEGRTAPDVCIITDQYVLIVEGKQTEGKRTTTTKWDNRRDQLIRHMDAFLDDENKVIYGLFICEESSKSAYNLEEYKNGHIFEQSLKHRDAGSIEKVREGYLGVISWEELEERFNVRIGQKPVKN